jgi:hypothetical protein
MNKIGKMRFSLHALHISMERHIEIKAIGTLSELDINQNETSRTHLFCIAAVLRTVHSSETFYTQCNNRIK